jgi:Tfp pilus assembly protein PilF
VRPALRALNAAITINPSRFSARTYRSAVLFHGGFHEAAAKDIDESILANPSFALNVASRAFLALYDGDFASADAFTEKALAMEPALVHANVMSPLPSVYIGELEMAREKLRKARQMVPEEPQLVAVEGLILAHEGDFKRAEQLADEAVANKRSLTHTHHTWHCAAGVYALCAKPEKAMIELKRCAETGLPNHRAFQNDPFLRSLRDRPEFIDLMDELRQGYRLLQQEFDLAGSDVSA